MKRFLIFLLLFHLAVAQQTYLSCIYSFTLFGNIYRCDLTINNPNGLNNYTEIGGVHLEGFTDADVIHLFRGVGSVSTNVPSIICDTFSNLIRIDLRYTGLTTINDSDFSKCTRVTELNLDHNDIISISTNAFFELYSLDRITLNVNRLTTLHENMFVNQQNLTWLNLGLNPFDTIPIGLFKPLENLQRLNLMETNITAFNNRWFTSTRLRSLQFGINRITALPGDWIGLEELIDIDFSYNQINEIPSGGFTGLSNLLGLFFSGNILTELKTDAFLGLENLMYLHINNNPIEVIHEDAFRGLDSLFELDLSDCRLRKIHPYFFDNLRNLNTLNLRSNIIETITPGAFVTLPNLAYINFSGISWFPGFQFNRLMTLHRNSFGNLTKLRSLDLTGNIINAIDRAIIYDAVNLRTLTLFDNLCVNDQFRDFDINRDQYLLMLENCFDNIGNIVDTTTDGDDEFSFFEAQHRGIVIRVNTTNEVQIALTSLNFVSSPMIEIFIGSADNTRSVIRINQETNVVTIPTPNIIERDQWNDIRVTWSNQSIIVYSGNSHSPFMYFTMEDFYPINYYGLRAVETSAVWSVQPLQ